MPPAPSTWSLEDFLRLATVTSSQSPLGHDSRRRHPLSSDLKVPNKERGEGRGMPFRRPLPPPSSLTPGQMAGKTIASLQR